jgi:hypothetical protein
MESLSKNEYTMKSREVEIGGITYKVSATTNAGLEAAVKSLTKSLEPKPKKRSKKDDDKNTEPEHV